MLLAYRASVLALLQAPSSPTPLVPNSQLDIYINTARSRVAVDGECVRANGTVTAGVGVVSFSISSIVVANPPLSAALVVRQGKLAGTSIDIRSWEWFSAYYLNAAATSTPRLAQQGQGSLGVIYVSSTGGKLSLDVVASPIPLVDDTTAEAIPYPWTDAVPFYAAWLAFMQLQRQADANMMMGRYQELMRAARQEVTPTVLPDYRPGGAGATLASAHQSIASSAPAGRG